MRRKLGKTGPEVSAIGLGCMSLSGVYGTSDDGAGIRLIHRAVERGVDHFDSSDMYGWGQNEELLGRALKGRRNDFLLASKGGMYGNEKGQREINGSPEMMASYPPPGSTASTDLCKIRACRRAGEKKGSFSNRWRRCSTNPGRC